MLPPPHEVVPHHVALLELEAPMRLASLGFKARFVLLDQLERGAVIDRRTPARELTLALELEFLGSLIGGIKPPFPLQCLDRGVIAAETVRLAYLLRPIDADPGEVLLDAARKFLGRALPVGVIEP